MEQQDLDISFLPRHDQGSRGTCMAFAVTSLLEYCFHYHGNDACLKDIRLSPQYLYARCKYEEQDDEKGTTLETAFEMVKKHGVCRESDWPYNKHETTPNQLGDAVEDEMQIKADRLPELDRLANVSCRDIQFHQLFTPSSVEECKSALRGDDGFRPMPVVVGCKVFPSFTERAIQDGWIPQPWPGEDKYGSGHAMLVTGYKDTPEFKSEGYFWALNSWGPSIFDDPAHRGMVKIPYEYYAKHVKEAGTIREQANGPYGTGPSTGLNTSKTNSHSDTIPETPNQMNSHSSRTNRAEHPATDLEEALTDIFPSVENNIKNSSCPLPYDFFHEPRTLFQSKKVKPAPPEDITGRFLGFINENIQSDNPPHGNIKVLPLCKDSSFLIVMATLAHMNGESVNMSDIKILQDFIRLRVTASNPKSHALTIIAANNFERDYHLSDTVILCTPSPHGLWNVRLPKAHHSAETINFLIHALPNSLDAYADRIAALASDYYSHLDYINKDFLIDKLALDPSIPDAFLDHWLNVLFARGGYARNKEGCIYPPGVNLPDNAWVTKSFI